MKNSGPKVIYWSVISARNGGIKVKFWSNEKNGLIKEMVKVTEDTLRAMVEDITGMKNFVLKEVKKDEMP